MPVSNKIKKIFYIVTILNIYFACEYDIISVSVPIQCTEVYDSLEKALKHPEKVCALHLNFYIQSGTWEVPPDIARLTNLKSLRIHSNIAKLPQELWRLESLEELLINGTNLSALPPEIGLLTNLKTLDVRSNQLTKLPSEISNLTSLQRLSVSNNKISKLPSEIGELSSLVSLDVMGNNLTEVPPEIGKLSRL